MDVLDKLEKMRSNPQDVRFFRCAAHRGTLLRETSHKGISPLLLDTMARRPSCESAESRGEGESVPDQAAASSDRSIGEGIKMISAEKYSYRVFWSEETRLS